MKKNKRIFKLPAFGSFVTFIVIVFSAFILWMVFEAERDYIFFMKDGASYNDCYASIATIDYSLSLWASEHNGKYPDKLSKLVPKYIKKIPFCPEAGRDTYSDSYFVSEDGKEYFFYCSCGEHGGQNGNVPQGVSSPDYFLTDDNRMPLKYECENGRMNDILKQNCKYRMSYSSGNYSDAEMAIADIISESKTRKLKLHLDRAEVLFKTGKYTEARDELSKSLSYGFSLSLWQNIEKVIAYTGDENIFKIKEIVRQYASAEGADNPEAVIFALYLCGKIMPADERINLSSDLLESGVLSGFPAVTELVLRGEIADASGNSVDSVSCFLAVRDFVCGNDNFDILIASMAESRLGNYNFKF